MAMTVTATQGGSTANGMALRVLVLTGAFAVASQTGATATVGTAAEVSITTTATGSRVYGATNGANGTWAADAATTNIDAIADATNGQEYVTFKTTALTGTPGAVTVGDSTAVSATGIAALEVLPSGTLAEDSSAPAVVSTTSATAVTTASFTPAASALLVALVSTDGGAAQTTMTVSGGSLAWTEKVKANAAGQNYVGVWIADAPAAGSASGPPLSPQFMGGMVPAVIVSGAGWRGAQHSR